MHFSYHGAGYALDPEYHQVDHGSIEDVMDDLQRVLERHYWDKPEKVALAKAEFAQYKAANVGHLTHPSTWTMARRCLHGSGGTSTVRICLRCDR